MHIEERAYVSFHIHVARYAPDAVDAQGNPQTTGEEAHLHAKKQMRFRMGWLLRMVLAMQIW
jgi:hypothetical protein